jgi:large subunit ribosomal protein L6
MARIGKRPIEVPTNVSITFENQKIIVKGQHGVLEQLLSENIKVKVQDNEIIVTRIDETKKSRELHGLIRALIQNMVQGVDKKFSKVLIAEGVGYKFQLDKKDLILNVGFSNPVKMEIPEDISVKIESPTKVVLSGISKERVGFVASKIRDIRPPEPYKGKGLMYEGEKIVRKAGKTGK